MTNRNIRAERRDEIALEKRLQHLQGECNKVKEQLKRSKENSREK